MKHRLVEVRAPTLADKRSPQRWGTRQTHPTGQSFALDGGEHLWIAGIVEVGTPEH
jgi:hypothetical protein